MNKSPNSYSTNYGHYTIIRRSTPTNRIHTKMNNSTRTN
uniref:Uncharacterized protein n=1 Tax=Anguilla anguilla TaxID=7936 RepID=A0A0E9SIQ1_ANGAN